MYTYMQTHVDEPGGIFGNNATILHSSWDAQLFRLTPKWDGLVVFHTNNDQPFVSPLVSHFCLIVIYA